ncbi:hypothetical protein NSQ38_01125 [Paenibacillus sp. FSL R7-0313]|uniref:hypothetical protein n=1 Tax=Paenibacillus sp. FSL R7-0313 TaxID=2954532 RepID=UPI000F934208|nr:hypothetical protein EDO6_02513 [Paenibacillus xylanexedens]
MEKFLQVIDFILNSCFVFYKVKQYDIYKYDHYSISYKAYAMMNDKQRMNG